MFHSATINTYYGLKSKPKIMKSGVPQGSCLGLLLYIAYVNDMDFCLDYCKIVEYADDVKVYKVMTTNTSVQQSKMMQSDPNKLQNWADEWQLSFNISKCCLLHYGHGNLCYDQDRREGGAEGVTVRGPGDTGGPGVLNCQV